MRLSISKTIPALALALAACGPSENTIAVPGGTVTQSTDGSTTTITATNGETTQISTGQAVALPASMPLFPGATVTTSITGGNETQKTISVAFDTSASVEEVIAFYKGKAAALGLAEALSSTESGVSTLVASKDQMSVIVAASKGTKGTEAQITWSAPPS